MLKLEMETDGDAFAYGELAYEVASILRATANRIQFEGQDSGVLMDSLGNAVGRWTLTTETED
jgi:hypothetical protein